MIKQVLLDGKPAYKINAVLLRATRKALLFDCDGDEIWIPKSVCKYAEEKNTILVLDWFYKQNIE